MRRKVLLTILGSILLLLILGAAYQILGSRIDARRSPEPGRLVDVGGYRLKINCAGSGYPQIRRSVLNNLTCIYDINKMYISLNGTWNLWR